MRERGFFQIRPPAWITVKQNNKRDIEMCCLIESAVQHCSFKTLPKGLRKHPISVTIIYSVQLRSETISCCGVLPFL